MSGMITADNYKDDKFYSKLVRAVEELLKSKPYIRASDVFKKMGLLGEGDYEQWQVGKLAYLEQTIDLNVSKINRILTILNLHAKEIGLEESIHFETLKSKNLRYTKLGKKRGEELFAKQYK